MKREELKNLGLSDEQINGVMAIHNTDNTTWQNQMNAANTRLAQFEGVDVQALTTERDSLKQQLADKDRSFAMENFFRDVQFSSGLAKDAAYAQFKAKNFTLKDGKFEQADAWLADLKKTEPGAFAVENDNQGQTPAQNQPQANPAPTQNQGIITTGMVHQGQSQPAQTDFDKYFQELNPGLKF